MRKTEVARLSGALLRTVKQMVEESSVKHADDAFERAQRQIGRPSQVVSFRKLVGEASGEGAGWGGAAGASTPRNKSGACHLLRAAPGVR